MTGLLSLMFCLGAGLFDGEERSSELSWADVELSAEGNGDTLSLSLPGRSDTARLWLLRRSVGSEATGWFLVDYGKMQTAVACQGPGSDAASIADCIEGAFLRQKLRYTANCWDPRMLQLDEWLIYRIDGAVDRTRGGDLEVVSPGTLGEWVTRRLCDSPRPWRRKSR